MKLKIILQFNIIKNGELNIPYINQYKLLRMK